MVEPLGWHCHRIATEERFTQVNFYFLILTVNDRKVRKIKTFLYLDGLSLTGIYTTNQCS